MDAQWLIWAREYSRGDTSLCFPVRQETGGSHVWWITLNLTSSAPTSRPEPSAEKGTLRKTDRHRLGGEWRREQLKRLIAADWRVPNFWKIVAHEKSFLRRRRCDARVSLIFECWVKFSYAVCSKYAVMCLYRKCIGKREIQPSCLTYTLRFLHKISMVMHWNGFFYN